MSETALIALGSNLGDRAATLRLALAKLAESAGIVVERVSTFHETDAVGGPAGQGKYLNAAAVLQTTLAPLDLLKALLAIEQGLGRTRGPKDGPRTLDLDMLFFGQQVLNTGAGEPSLIVPHPRLHERWFVLAPLVEIAPHVNHPTLGRCVTELLDALSPLPRELAGRRALVTGSSSGIGRAIALELASAGAQVIVHGRRSQEAIDGVTAHCIRHGKKAHGLRADLADVTVLAPFAESAWQTWDGIDIWVNNAGADTLTGAAARWPFEQKLAAIWDVDVRATMLLAREVGARMHRQGDGVIINVGWDQADTGMEGDSGQLFGATKGAVMAFSKGLAASLAPQVRVNCVAPGWIRTAWGEEASQAWQERVIRETPLARWGTPEDVARTVRWLASPAASFITGQTIRVNGGAVR